MRKISKSFPTYFDGGIGRLRTIQYFDGKCPYTGEPLGRVNSEDHVIPMNREFCGLHVYGNVLIVSSTANANKHNRSLEEFIGHDLEKLNRIKSFLEETGYHQIHNQLFHRLAEKANEIYSPVRFEIESRVVNYYE